MKFARLSFAAIAWLVGCCCACWLLIPAAGQAQDTGAMAGTVTDARSGEPRADVNVVVVGTLAGATTDAEGRFEITDVEPDTYTVEVSSAGYRTARRAVDVVAGETVEVNFRLTPAEDTGEALDVAAELAALQPTRTLDARSIRDLAAPDLGAALRMAPGVESARRGMLGMEPSVRGLTGDALGVFVDGARWFSGSPIGTDAPLSRLDPSAVEQIEVVPGPYALAHGNTMGAIRAETASMEPGQGPEGRLNSHFRFNGEATETAGMLGGSVAALPYRFHGSYRTGNAYRSGDGTAVPANFESGAFHGQLGVPFSETADLTLRGGYQEQRDVDFPGRTLDAEKGRSGYGSVAYQHTSGVGVYRGLTAQAYAAQRLQRTNNTGRTVTPQLLVDAELQTFGGRIATQLSPGAQVATEVGVDGYTTYREAGQGRFEIDSTEIWPGARHSEVGLFVIATRSFDPVEVAAMARVDWAQADADADRVGETVADEGTEGLSSTDVLPSGSLLLRAPLTETWSVGLGGGTVARSADATERYADRAPATRAQTEARVIGTPGLDPERSSQGDLWLEGESDDWTLTLSGFVRRVSDSITLVPTDEDFELRHVNGTSTFAGAEIEGTYDLNPLVTARAQGAYLWGEDDRPDEPAFGVAPATVEVGLRGEAPFEDALFLDVAARAMTEQSRVAELRGEPETSGFITADVRLGFSPAGPASFVLSIDNITGTDYARPLNAVNPETQRRVLEPGRTVGLRLWVDF